MTRRRLYCLWSSEENHLLLGEVWHVCLTVWLSHKSAITANITSQYDVKCVCVLTTADCSKNLLNNVMFQFCSGQESRRNLDSHSQLYFAGMALFLTESLLFHTYVTTKCVLHIWPIPRGSGEQQPAHAQWWSNPPISTLRGTPSWEAMWYDSTSPSPRTLYHFSSICTGSLKQRVELSAFPWKGHCRFCAYFLFIYFFSCKYISFMQE